MKPKTKEEITTVTGKEFNKKIMEVILERETLAFAKGKEKGKERFGYRQGFIDGHKEAMREVKKAIKELQQYGSDGLKRIYYIDIDELLTKLGLSEEEEK